MIGVGQRKQVPSGEEAAKAAALWGSNPVHPTAAACRCMAKCLVNDIPNDEARYANPTKPPGGQKRPKIDLSLERDKWVVGCSAAAPRRDIAMDHASGNRDSAGPMRPPRRGHYIQGTSRGSAMSLRRAQRGVNRGGYGRRGCGRGRWGSF